MRKLILVKYASEIFLKGLNRNKFEKKLRDNIKKKLKGLEYEIISDQGRYFIKVDDLEEGIDRVRKVFGVSEVCIVTEVSPELDVIKKEALEKINLYKPKDFKVITNRANKRFEGKSMDISRDIGSFILEHYKDELSVKVKDSECQVFVEIRERAY
ncbi:MAG: THUMP domain-containing protein, partial [Clostridium sp.]